MRKVVISTLLNKRDALLNKNNNDKTADEIQKKISTAIRENFNKYEVDFVLETWTRFGASPNLIYDDNGLFAVTGDKGFQQVVTGRKILEGNFIVMVEKKQWKKTIREALKHYIKA